MINQFKLIRFHPLFWLVAATAVFTGFFYELLLLFLIVFLHELGHAAVALHYNWRIKKIELLPFGGVMETAEHGNRPVREEAMVAAAGPIVHLPLIAISFLLLKTPYWHEADHALFLHYNLTLFCFNLLPVWPLDGGKLLFCWFTSRFPYYQAQKRMWKTSCLLLCSIAALFLWSFPLHLQAWVLLIFFITVHYTEWKQQPYSFFRFLLERTNENSGYSSVIEKISWHERPMDAAKTICKKEKCQFYILENGQTLPESYILEAITMKRMGMVKIRDLLLEDERKPFVK
ncbi:M50 family metallopeptidase [Alteribacillus bidgolensis]|uniref:Sporulation factor SpoIVFB. Metallo peptidase. MEROPS family M50B n=1 Tax=Alteribacillus bidgolensis TaxID=930129 RepID=A0A1G8MR85_9BACI|nr:M50 family metallopeptidase [Alteribacillus bidgolensis]SDI69800.1 sporulation factor SpoIVFB. Metallo peptidase. MEROPS family M50B [Alteribacillus bidgolensis]